MNGNRFGDHRKWQCEDLFRFERNPLDRKPQPFFLQNEIAAALWQKAGIQPQGDWLLKSDSNSSEQAIEFARTKQAYVVLGRIPALEQRQSPNDLEILVQDEPEMHRSFVVLEANPQKVPQANARGARALADFLLEPKTQDFLRVFATNNAAGMPVFQPLNRR